MLNFKRQLFTLATQVGFFSQLKHKTNAFGNLHSDLHFVFHYEEANMLMEVLGFANDLCWRRKRSSERGTDGDLTESNIVLCQTGRQLY